MQCSHKLRCLLLGCLLQLSGSHRSAQASEMSLRSQLQAAVFCLHAGVLPEGSSREWTGRQLRRLLLRCRHGAQRSAGCYVRILELAVSKPGSASCPPQDWQSETSGARQEPLRGRSDLAMHYTWAAGGHLCRRPPWWAAELRRHLQRQAGSLQRNKQVPASLVQAKLGFGNHASKEHGVRFSAQQQNGDFAFGRVLSTEDPDGSEPGWSDMRGLGQTQT